MSAGIGVKDVPAEPILLQCAESIFLHRAGNVRRQGDCGQIKRKIEGGTAELAALAAF
jgi:hypothetical protein